MAKQKSEQMSLIPAWNPGDMVLINRTGLVGTILTPLSWEMDVWWVDVRASVPVRCHATEMTKFDNIILP